MFSMFSAQTIFRKHQNNGKSSWKVCNDRSLISLITLEGSFFRGKKSLSNPLFRESLSPQPHQALDEVNHFLLFSSVLFLSLPISQSIFPSLSFSFLIISLSPLPFSLSLSLSLYLSLFLSLSLPLPLPLSLFLSPHFHSLFSPNRDLN